MQTEQDQELSKDLDSKMEKSARALTEPEEYDFVGIRGIQKEEKFDDSFQVDIDKL